MGESLEEENVELCKKLLTLAFIRSQGSAPDDIIYDVYYLNESDGVPDVAMVIQLFATNLAKMRKNRRHMGKEEEEEEEEEEELEEEQEHEEQEQEQEQEQEESGEVHEEDGASLASHLNAHNKTQLFMPLNIASICKLSRSKILNNRSIIIVTDLIMTGNNVRL